MLFYHGLNGSGGFIAQAEQHAAIQHMEQRLLHAVSEAASVREEGALASAQAADAAACAEERRCQLEALMATLTAIQVSVGAVCGSLSSRLWACCYACDLAGDCPNSVTNILGASCVPRMLKQYCDLTTGTLQSGNSEATSRRAIEATVLLAEERHHRGVMERRCVTPPASIACTYTSFLFTNFMSHTCTASLFALSYM